MTIFSCSVFSSLMASRGCSRWRAASRVEAKALAWVMTDWMLRTGYMRPISSS